MNERKEPKTWDDLGIVQPADNLITKSQMRESYRQHQLPKMRELWDAEMTKAMGVAHFMLRDPETGQFRRLTDPDEIQAALNHPDAAAGSTYYVHSKDPDPVAIKGILDRCMDKPKEQEQEFIIKGEVELVSRLDRAKERARKGKTE